MIELEHVSKRYGETMVLTDIAMTIAEPGIYCLLGRNGAGKTTLLKAIAGYHNVSGGTIRVDGKRISTQSMKTDVSYIENFARHFNLPIRTLFRMAEEVNPQYDHEFSEKMVERFELDVKKRFNHLSLGMKTMVSTVICLSSNRSVILLDEPVLGFDAIMRIEFYEMLSESFLRHPRIIIVSTHIIEEIAKTVQKLIIIDKGRLCFFDTLKSVEEKAFCISGLRKDVENATCNLNVFAKEHVGGLETAYIFDTAPDKSDCLEINSLSLQEFFVHLVSHKGGDKI